MLSALLKGSSGKVFTNLSTFCAVSHLASVARTKFSFACNQQTSASSAEHWANPVLRFFFFLSSRRKLHLKGFELGSFLKHTFSGAAFLHDFTEEALNIQGEKEQSLGCVCLGVFLCSGQTHFRYFCFYQWQCLVFADKTMVERNGLYTRFALF